MVMMKICSSIMIMSRISLHLIRLNFYGLRRHSLMLKMMSSIDQIPVGCMMEMEATFFIMMVNMVAYKMTANQNKNEGNFTSSHLMLLFKMGSLNLMTMKTLLLIGMINVFLVIKNYEHLICFAHNLGRMMVFLMIIE